MRLCTFSILYCNTSIRISFADFSKGFDLVDHNVLLEELHVLNVDPSIIRWIGAFLSERSQRVKVGKSLSSPVSLHGGIPQGTKLAPLLFDILVKRLVATWPCRLKYVDDTTVFEAIPRCSPSYLPLIVNDISCFPSLRGMRLNPKKCKVMDINFLQYQPGPPAPITIQGLPCPSGADMQAPWSPCFSRSIMERACRAHSHQSL